MRFPTRVVMDACLTSVNKTFSVILSAALLGIFLFHLRNVLWTGRYRAMDIDPEPLTMTGHDPDGGG